MKALHDRSIYKKLPRPIGIYITLSQRSPGYACRVWDCGSYTHASNALCIYRCLTIDVDLYVGIIEGCDHYFAIVLCANG